MSEALRKALKVIDKHSVSAIRTNSKDRGDWAEDMAYVGKVAREALAQPPAQPSAKLTELIAGALYDLMGDLTTRDETLRLGAFELATPACDALDAFAKKRGLSLDNPAIEDWHAGLSADPPMANGLTEAQTRATASVAGLSQPPAPTAQPATEDDLRVYDAIAAGYAQPVQQPTAPLQGGMDNAELLAAWQKKLPGVEPSATQLTAFAVGVEVGFAHARDLERQDWNRVHHALAKHGVHPGRTDDHLADVIDRALAAPAQRQPLTVPALTDAQMSECAWGYVADSRNLDAGVTGIIQATQLACAAAWGITLAAQKGEKL